MALLRNHGCRRNGPEGVTHPVESVPGTVLSGELPEWGAGNEFGILPPREVVRLGFGMLIGLLLATTLLPKLQAAKIESSEPDAEGPTLPASDPGVT
jgi:hypothetical protein